MAVNIIEEPSDSINLIGDPIVFRIQMTGVDTAQERRRFGYQIIYPGGVLSSEESHAPAEGVTFPINVQRDARKAVYTRVPMTENDQERVETEMLSEISLRYWEIVFNKETCQTERQGETVIGPYPVMNGAYQYYQDYTDKRIFLTPKPRYYSGCRDHFDLFYMWTPSTTSLSFRLWFRGGDNVLLETYVAQPARVNAYVINPIDLAQGVNHIIDGINYSGTQLVSRATGIGIEVGGFEMSRMMFDQCCSDVIVYFMHPQGGYSVMSFEEVTSKEMSVRQNTVNFPQELTRSSFLNRLVRGGIKPVSKESKRRMKLRRLVNFDDVRNEQYREDFYSAGNYLIGFIDDNLKQSYISAYLVPGTYKYFDIDGQYYMEATLEINQPVQMPNYRL